MSEGAALGGPPSPSKCRCETLAVDVHAGVGAPGQLGGLHALHHGGEWEREAAAKPTPGTRPPPTPRRAGRQVGGNRIPVGAHTHTRPCANHRPPEQCETMVLSRRHPGNLDLLCANNWRRRGRQRRPGHDLIDGNGKPPTVGLEDPSEEPLWEEGGGTWGGG